MVPYFMIQSAFSLALMVNRQKIRSEEKAVLVGAASIMSVEVVVFLGSGVVMFKGEEVPVLTCLVAIVEGGQMLRPLLLPRFRDLLYYNRRRYLLWHSRIKS